MSRSESGVPARSSIFSSRRRSLICETDSFLFPENSTAETTGRSSIVTTSVTPPPPRSASTETFSSSPTSHSF
jgi:hypothetical protein